MNGKKNSLNTYKITVTGIVQGVGFRPFIYRLSQKYKLKGSVTNTTEGVLIYINTSNTSTLNGFISDIRTQKPSASFIEEINSEEVSYRVLRGFRIKKSMEAKEKFQLISPDIATCGSCIEDINKTEDSRRYYYPFTNCTNCGPRFTIIKKMPYDRPNTTMHKFALCDNCAEEFSSPSNRRFHAQPNACKKCGPKLILTDRNGNKINTESPLIKTAELLKKKKIIAIKSLGGFQIACDATSDSVVSELRKRKKRPVKPFAVMIKNIDSVKKHCFLSKKEQKSLTSSRAPIVLLRKKPEIKISRYVSLYNKYEGVMLPYTPIHHLLFNNINVPLVMTSGNISEEPIAAENQEAYRRLGEICDYFLIHNRDIYSRYDDSVIKIFDDKEMIIRRARGYSPYPVKLGKDIGKHIILAAGAHEKNTFCFMVKNYGIVSQHIGDLDDVESIEFFTSTYKNYKKLFNIDKIDLVAYDKHPDYASSRFAKKINSINKIEVQHHHAHIASVIAENNITGSIIGFAWDGTGYGDDKKIWGSETFITIDGLNYKRMAHLKEKVLPGGEITIKNPKRMAVTYLHYLWNRPDYSSKEFSEYIYSDFPFYKRLIPELEIETIQKQIRTGFNSITTTSMGRLFDAVSSILDCTHSSTFEGEAAVHLEMTAADDEEKTYDIKIDKIGNKYIIDDLYIFNQIIKDIRSKIEKSKISARFHNTLVEIVTGISQMIRKTYNINSVALSGGVFQNNYLLSRCYDALKKNSFNVYSNFKVPVNDGGISLGQAYIAALKILSPREGALKSCV
jgi:hydrogenase maturation protein HypF